MVWSLDLIVVALSVVLTAWVFSIYLKRALDVRSSFAKGLALLSALFFVQSLVSVVVYYRFSGVYSVDVALPLFVISTLDLGGFAVLFWIARQ